MKTPNLDKMKLVSNENRIIGDFLTWIEQKNILLSKYHGDDLVPFRKNIDELLMEYSDINPLEVENERRMILEQMNKGQ